MKRREFIAGIGAVAWPLVASAQQPRDRLRRVGLLMGSDENDPVTKGQLSAFAQALAGLGWADGRDVRIDPRWGGSDINRIRALAQELVGSQPDIILTLGTPGAIVLQRETQTIPIVFTNVADPVASGIVASLNRPGGNITGFAFAEPSMGGKWLELLTEIAPSVKRGAAMFNPDTAPVLSAFMRSIETAARSLKVALMPAPVYSDVEIDTAIMALGREPGGGLVMMPDVFVTSRIPAVILAAARNNVPAVCPITYFARDGGLLSYGADVVDAYRRAATYVDRILRGAKPGDLPVQFPTKYEMVVNLRTAKSLGLTVPASILLRADEVIE
jgi:putative tryptophan/tyrosine transport system substrate-binding protein